jgi:predicted nuclease of predicted toxin-antitoxin system
VKFLLDQDVYAVTARYLKSLRHDIVTASQIGAAQAEDAKLLERASEQERIFVTRDKDFGGLVFVEHRGTGVIFLRILPSTVRSVHDELGNVLRSHTEAEPKNAFVVVEPGRHRFRKLA